jgi:hypothetical protein
LSSHRSTFGLRSYPPSEFRGFQGAQELVRVKNSASAPAQIL